MNQNIMEDLIYGVCTINLPYIALSSEGDMDKFWKLLDDKLELCHIALKTRYKRLENMPSDIAPLLWQHGAFARLDKGEKIGKLFYGGYATISLGYAGLYECVKYMNGHSHTDNDTGKKFGLGVMQKLNDKCEQWKQEEDVGYSVYGSPIENCTYKFAKSLQKSFGIIEGITDRDYVTNSSHVPVFEEIDIFSKIKIESEFQKLSSGGIVGYGEIPNMTNNIDALLEVLKYIYDNIMYYEFNTKSDYCMECGYDGEMQIDNNLEWYCPNCGNRDHSKLWITRRTCGKN